MYTLFLVKDAAAVKVTFAIYNEYLNEDHSSNPCYNDNHSASCSNNILVGGKYPETLMISGQRQAFPRDWLKKVHGLELDGCIELIEFESQDLVVNNSGLQDLSCEPIVLPYWLDAMDVFQHLPSSCAQMFWAKSIEAGMVTLAHGEVDVPFLQSGDGSINNNWACHSVIESAYRWIASDEATAVRTLQLVKGYLKVAANLQTITADSIRNM